MLRIRSKRSKLYLTFVIERMSRRWKRRTCYSGRSTVKSKMLFSARYLTPGRILCAFPCLPARQSASIIRGISAETSRCDVRKGATLHVFRVAVTFIGRFNPAGKVVSSVSSAVIIQRNYGAFVKRTLNRFAAATAAARRNTHAHSHARY